MNLGVNPMSLTSSTTSWKSSDGVSCQFPAGLRVLVVDDDPTCLRILEIMLRKCHYEVTKCSSAKVALKLLRDHEDGFDIVISDVHMPDMDGFKLLELVGLEMDLPVIMMSADDRKNVVMKGVNHGACDYLIKPVQMEALKNIWQHVVHRRKHNYAQQARSVAQAKRCSIAATNPKKEDSAKKTERGHSKTALQLNLEDLKPHFGKRLKDVAEEIGVGRSTIKRTCRNYGIHRWPCNEKQKKNPSLFETESANKIVRDSQQNILPSSSGSHLLLDMPLHQNMPQSNTKSTQHLTVLPEDEKFIIKAKYEDDIVKFQLCLPSGMDEIVEEVAMRLNLKMGCFKLKYLDEDNDEILLACDVDLQFCLKSLTAAGKTCLQLFVQLIRK